MGIPRFYGTWLRRSFPDAIVGNPRACSSLLIDANALLHNVAQIAYAYGDGFTEERYAAVLEKTPEQLKRRFFDMLLSAITTLVTFFGPTETFVLAVDGVAPQAKIAQQRTRRFRSGKLRRESTRKSLFDPNSITPGTEFMAEVNERLKEGLAETITGLPPRVIYSSHMVPGEGEHKIMEIIRGGLAGDGSHVIWGKDADFIVLSMISPSKRILICREEITGEKEILDVDSLRLGISKKLGNKPGVIDDFAVLITIVGNDFLPSNPAFEDFRNSIDTLIDVYRKRQVPLVVDGYIQWARLASLLQDLVPIEQDLMEKEAQRRHNYSSWMITAATEITQSVEMKAGGTITSKATKFSFPKFRTAWYSNALMARGSGEKLPINAPRIQGMIMQYFVGLAWIASYYFRGLSSISLSWYYPYHHAPLIMDMAAVLPGIGKVEGWEPVPGQTYLNPIHQLLCVMPLTSQDLLPPEVRHLMQDSVLTDIYPEDFYLDLAGKSYQDQGIPMIPFVDPERIFRAVIECANFSPERLAQFSPESTVPIVRERLAVKKIRTTPVGRGGFGRGRSREVRGGRRDIRSRTGTSRPPRTPRGRGSVPSGDRESRQQQWNERLPSM